MNITEEIHASLNKILFTNFHNYVLDILTATNTPKSTIIKVEEKIKENPNDPIFYFDRAVFIDYSHEDQLKKIKESKKIPVLIFLINEKQVYVKNTITNEEISFKPNEISSQVLFLLPIIQGLKGQNSNSQTWKFAELVTVLKNQIIKDDYSNLKDSSIPFFILDIIKSGIVFYYIANFEYKQKLKLLEQYEKKVKVKKYTELIVRYVPNINKSNSNLKNNIETLSDKSFNLVKTIFLYDYGDIDSEILGSIIYRVVGAGDNSKSHLVSEENANKMIVPLLVEPYLLPLVESNRTKKDNLEALKEVLNFTFLDPTNGTGSLLASAMKKISSFMNLAKSSSDENLELKIENFYAINEDPIGVEISKIVIWLTFIGLSYKPTEIEPEDLIEKYNSVNIIKGNPLSESWAVCHKNKLPNFIFGVPTFKGWHKMNEEEKNTFKEIAQSFNPSNLDYSAAWLVKAANLIKGSDTQICFGLTNSLVQGKQVEILWPNIFSMNLSIAFTYPSFKWINDTKQNTGVTAVIISLIDTKNRTTKPTIRFSGGVKEVEVIGPYLVEGVTEIIKSRSKRKDGSQLPLMVKGNMPYDAGNLLLTPQEKAELVTKFPHSAKFIKKIVGSDEYINSIDRYCLWISNEELKEAMSIDLIARRVEAVREFRKKSSDVGGRKLALRAHQFREFRSTISQSLVVPSVSSENRKYIPIGFVGPETIISNLSFAIYECDSWVLPILASSMHMCWASVTCGNLETRIRYSSQLCYNTFPLPILNNDQIVRFNEYAYSLIACREKFPNKSLGNLYSQMPIELKEIHAKIDYFIDGIYGLNGTVSDQDRTKKLLEMYQN